MSIVNNQGAEDWELGDAIPIPLDLDDEPEDEPEDDDSDVIDDDPIGVSDICR